MKNLLAIAAATLATASFAADRPQDRWNLADLYPSVEAWNADAQKVEAGFADIAACKGHLGDSAKRMRECLDLQSDTLKRYFRLAVYANELYAENTGESSSLSLRQRSQVLGSKLSEATSFVSPEVLAIGRDKTQAFLKEEKGLPSTGKASTTSCAWRRTRWTWPVKRWSLPSSWPRVSQEASTPASPTPTCPGRR
jgi:oligoendopeptidase F